MSRHRFTESTEKAQRNTDNLPRIQKSLCDFLFCLCYANGIMDVTTQADEKTGLWLSLIRGCSVYKAEIS